MKIVKNGYVHENTTLTDESFNIFSVNGILNSANQKT